MTLLMRAFGQQARGHLADLEIAGDLHEIVGAQHIVVHDLVAGLR
jgi:hypothetical protein